MPTFSGGVTYDNDVHLVLRTNSWHLFSFLDTFSESLFRLYQSSFKTKDPQKEHYNLTYYYKRGGFFFLFLFLSIPLQVFLNRGENPKSWHLEHGVGPVHVKSSRIYLSKDVLYSFFLLLLLILPVYRFYDLLISGSSYYPS